ncbi:MAG: response regulator [Deltaproteobacteria bacterium]|nr:response regulator [Deltaproteobacteria bacterium]
MKVERPRASEDDRLTAAAEIRGIENAVIADVLTRVVPIGVLAAAGAVVLVAATSLDQPLRFVPPGFALGMLMVAWLATHRARYDRALAVCLVALAGATVFGLTLNGGIDAPAWKLIYFVIVVSAWTYGRRGSVIATALATALAITIAVLEHQDVLPHAAHATIAFTLVISLLTAWLVWFASSVPQRHFRSALTRALARERDLAAEQARRMKAENERLALEAQLRHAQKMQAIGTLAGGIAHDFNNILASVVANLELVRGDLDATHPAHESLHAIELGATRATELVRQILMFSHKEPSTMTVLPLRTVVQEAVGFLRAAMPAAIALDVVLADDVPHVLADPTRLHQVFMNLGTNAWHAIEPASGRVEIRVDTITTTTAGAVPPGRYARITITDTGCGMDAATRDRIFEPFFTTKSKGKGAGLGLAVVHGILDEHGGAISVTSEPGHGTSFEVLLPAVAEPAEAAPPQPAREVPPGRGQRIFFIDDEVALLRAGARSLERLGYQATTFARPEDALALLRVDPRAADLVITDHSMPGMSGVALAAELTRLRPELPVVVISGHVDTVDPAAVPHRLAKPYRAHELADLLRTLLPQS